MNTTDTFGSISCYCHHNQRNQLLYQSALATAVSEVTTYPKRDDISPSKHVKQQPADDKWRIGRCQNRRGTTDGARALLDQQRSQT